MAQRRTRVASVGAIFALLLLLAFATVYAQLTPLGCFSVDESTDFVPLSVTSTNSVVTTCANFCVANRGISVSFGLANRINNATAVNCYCFPADTSSFNSSNDQCLAHCIDERSPVLCGTETLWSGNLSYGGIVTQFAAVYSLESAGASVFCEDLCNRNVSLPCHASPFSAECAEVLAPCHVGNAVAASANCVDPSSSLPEYSFPPSGITAQKDNDQYNYFMRSSSDAYSLQLEVTRVDGGCNPYNCKPGYMIEAGTWLETPYIPVNYNQSFVPKGSCPGSGAEYCGLGCSPGCPATCDLQRPSLMFKTVSVNQLLFNQYYFTFDIYFAPYPYNVSEHPCRDFYLNVQGGQHNNGFNVGTMVERMHTYYPHCATAKPRWRFDVNPDANVGHWVRSKEAYTRYGCSVNPTWDLDFEIVAHYIGGTEDGGVFTIGGDQCLSQPNPTEIKSSDDIPSFSNCAVFENDVYIFFPEHSNYANVFVETTGFSGSLLVGNGQPVKLIASALRDLTTIAGSLTIGNGASIDFSGCTANIAVGGDFNLLYGSGNFGRITSINGGMTLAGDLLGSTLPPVSAVTALTLENFVGQPGSVIVTQTGLLRIVSNTHFNYTFSPSFTMTSVEIDLSLTTASLMTVLQCTTLVNLNLVKAALITSAHFPNLTTVTNTLTISQVVAFDWTRPAVSVQNLVINAPESGVEFATSLGGLRLSVWGDLTINNSDLEDLSFLVGITTLRSLTITNNGLLKNLTGLEGLQTVTGNVLVTDNSKALDITALGSLVSVGGTLKIVTEEAEYTSVLQPCPCNLSGMLCTLSLTTFESRLAVISDYVAEGDSTHQIAYMSQGLLCAKALPTNTSSHVTTVTSVVSDVAVLSYAKNETNWNLLALDAYMFLKTQLLGPTTPLFVPMDATEVLVAKMQSFVEILSAAEQAYEELLEEIEEIESVKAFKQKQLDRTSALVAGIYNQMQANINRRDEAIEQMVTAADEVEVAVGMMMGPMNDMAACIASRASGLSAAFAAIMLTVEDLGKLSGITRDFKWETLNTTGAFPSEPPPTGSSLTNVWAYFSAAGKLFGVVGDFWARGNAIYTDWTEANEALEKFALVLEHAQRYYTYITDIEIAIHAAASDGTLGNLTQALQAGNFTKLVEWIILPNTLDYALATAGICRDLGTGMDCAVAACDQLRLATEIMATWGSQITWLVGVASEYERAIGTSMATLDKLAIHSKDLAQVLDGQESMNQEAIAAAEHMAEDFLATLSTVGLNELQQLCASYNYYDPNSQRAIGGCDVSTQYVGMSSMELQRRLFSVSYNYEAAMRDRDVYRTSYVPKVDVTSLLGDLTTFFDGTMVTVEIEPWMIRKGPIATGQNAEWQFIYVTMDGLPATMGDPDAPNIDVQIRLQSPFTKLERFVDGSVVNHTFALWGVQANFAFRVKEYANDACIASIAVPGNMAPEICMDGITDGIFNSLHYQLPALFSTVVLQIANVNELLAYNENFFENVTAVYIGGVVITNPRPHRLLDTDVRY